MIKREPSPYPCELMRSPRLVRQPLYMSPEMAQGKAYTSAADCWALGCILYEMMCLGAPWLTQLGARAKGLNVPALMRHISNSTLDTDALRPYYSDSLCALVCALVSRDPASRPSLASVLEWPIMRSFAPAGAEGVLPSLVPPTGIEKHAAAQVLQRSFRRDRMMAPAPTDPPTTANEPDSWNIDATQVMVPRDNQEVVAAAADVSRRAAAVAAHAALHPERPAPQSARPALNDFAGVAAMPQLLVPAHHDVRPAFFACPVFAGAHEGCVFRNGASGLGYYRDRLSIREEGQRIRDDAAQQQPSSARAAAPVRLLRPHSGPQARVPARKQPLPTGERATKPTRPADVAAAPPLGHIRAGMARVPSAAEIYRGAPMPQANVAPRPRRVPSAAGIFRGIEPMPDSAAPMSQNDPGKHGCAAAVAAAQAAKRALDAASVARHSAAGVMGPGVALPPSALHAWEAAPVRADVIAPVDLEPSDAHLLRDPIAARQALRAALEGGRSEEVEAAAKAAQKIIESFKRSQKRRRAAAACGAAPTPRALPRGDQAAPAERVTLNRRYAPRAPSRAAAVPSYPQAVPQKVARGRPPVPWV